MCRGGGIGRRDGFKIRFPRECRFESDPRYHYSVSRRFEKYQKAFIYQWLQQTLFYGISG